MKTAPDGSPVKYPDAHVKLTGTDGNAFAVMGRVIAALRQAKASEDQVNTFLQEAMNGTHDHLLATCMAWVDVT